MEAQVSNIFLSMWN